MPLEAQRPDQTGPSNTTPIRASEHWLGPVRVWVRVQLELEVRLRVSRIFIPPHGSAFLSTTGQLRLMVILPVELVGSPFKGTFKHVSP